MRTMTLDDHVAVDSELAPRNVVGSDGDIRARYLALVGRLDSLDNGEYRELKALGARLDRTPIVDWKDDGNRVQTDNLKLAERDKVKERRAELAAARKRYEDYWKGKSVYRPGDTESTMVYEQAHTQGMGDKLVTDIRACEGKLWNAEHADEVAARFRKEWPQTFGP